MKTCSLLFFLGLLALSLAGCTSHPDQVRAPGHTLEIAHDPGVPQPFATGGDEDPWPANQTISRAVADMDKHDVLQWLGRPGERLTPDFWIYWRYHSPEDAAANGGHDTLVVAFTRGRVSGMKLVQGEVLRTRLAGGWRPRVDVVRR